MEVERGSLLSLFRALKKTVSVPVIGVGRLDRPEIFRGRSLAPMPILLRQAGRSWPIPERGQDAHRKEKGDQTMYSLQFLPSLSPSR